MISLIYGAAAVSAAGAGGMKRSGRGLIAVVSTESDLISVRHPHLEEEKEAGWGVLAHPATDYRVSRSFPFSRRFPATGYGATGYGGKGRWIYSQL